jgi:hypothetical protein
MNPIECVECGKPATQNVSYWTPSQGFRSFNLCSDHSAQMWEKGKNNPELAGAVFSPPKSKSEIEALRVSIGL